MNLPITQEHGSGCGVACVAYVLGLSYQKALKLFAKPEQAWGRGFYWKELVAALKKGGRKYSFCRLNESKKNLLKNSEIIVYEAPSPKYPIGHYLTRTSDGCWMNPWSNFPIIASAKSSFQKKLPGKVTYLIFPIE